MTAPQSQPDPPFVMFGVDHAAGLLAVALLSAGLSALLARFRGPAGRLRARAVCRTIAGLLLVYAVSWPLYRLAVGQWRVADSVPLHLCDLAVFVTAAALVVAVPHDLAHATPARSAARRQWWFELAYYWVLGGTTQALLTPDLRFGFPHFQYLKFFAGHGLTVVAVCILLFALRRRPRPGSALRAWAFTLALLPAVGLFNWLTGSNYMYLCGPPRNPSLFDYFGPWPLSVLTLILAALVMMHVCYAPFWILRLRDRDRDGASLPPPACSRPDVGTP